MSKKKKKLGDTREFTALKNSTNCSDKKSDKPAEKMVFTDRTPKPGFEV